MEFTIITGKRFTSNLLYCDSYIYKIRSKYQTTIYYSCYTKNCLASLKFDQGIPSILRNHNHEPDGAEYLIMMFKNDIKTACRETNASMRNIFDEISRKPEYNICSNQILYKN